jgi:hypothetical protein
MFKKTNKKVSHVTYTDEQRKLFERQGIRIHVGKKVIPQGTIVVNEKSIILMAKSFSLIIPYISVESYASMIEQSIVLFNKVVCANGIDQGTKMYKNI